MLESNSNIPKNIDNLMDIYENYEKKDRKEEFTPGFHQFDTFGHNPITPFHKEYYNTKYKTKHYTISYILLILSIILSSLYFIGFSIEAYIFELPGLRTELIARILLFSIPIGAILVLLFLIVKDLNKWNWISYAVWSSIFVAAILTGVAFLRSFTGEEETFFNIIYTASGIGWAPACLTFYITYKHHTYITDYGGIHLFLGWIYRISKTHGDLKSLQYSFEKLLIDLDSWLNHTLDLIIKKRTLILEGFSLNIISDANFIDNISKIYKTEFESALTGLLVDDILNSNTFKDIPLTEKKISKLNKFTLKYLSYKLALDQLPKITDIINKLSSKELEVRYYSTKQRFNKYKPKILSFLIFLAGTILPLLLPVVI